MMKVSSSYKDGRQRTTVRIRITIDKGIVFSATIFVVVATSAFDLDEVENHWLSMISTMRGVPNGF